MAKKTTKKTTKKTANDLPDPFDAVTCERLRLLRDKVAELASRIANAKMDIKAWMDELEEYPDHPDDDEMTEIVDTKAAIYDATQTISDSNKALKLVNEAIGGTLANADQGELFDDPAKGIGLLLGL